MTEPTLADIHELLLAIFRAHMGLIDTAEAKELIAKHGGEDE